MANDEHGRSGATDRLLVEIHNTLTESERLNKQRHVELVAAMRCKSDVLDRLNSLKARLTKIAKAMAALDAQTQ